MIEVSAPTVESLDLDYLNISWSVANTDTDVLGYEFYVERSESPEGPFDQVAGPFIDRYTLRDYIAPQKRSWRSLYYRIRVVKKADQSSYFTAAKNAEPRPPLDGLEITRLTSLLFREYTGRPCLVYSVRTFGQRCGACYDKISGRRTVGSCLSCWNTGFARGFFRPIVSYIQIDPNDRNQQNTQQFVSEQAMVTARCSIYPLVKVRDIIVERENRRWRVVNVRRTERLRSPIHQELSLALIPPGDIEFKIPVQWPEDEKTSPRSFETRMDI